MAVTYFQRAVGYAQRVIDGREVAGRYERLFCERFLRDLDRQGTEGFPYVIDEVKGSRECRFIELMPHIKGDWARPVYEDGKLRYATIVLEDWQVAIEFQIFGWVHQATGKRRFRRSYEEIARKNAKSTRLAARELYMLTADGEPGAQCYSAATTGKQARELFDVAREMTSRETEFQARFGVEPRVNDITVRGTASTFQPLNAQAGTLDGLNVHGGAVDEVHAHKTRKLWDVLDSATGARSQPLLSAITTAGWDRSGICYELRDYTIKVLEGVQTDESWFGVIYTIDEGDVWHDPKVWRKANPNLGISVNPDDLADACNKARATPSAQSNFLTKHLNVWVSSSSAWMQVERWNACGDAKLAAKDFAGCKCWIGLDLAEKNDFAAAVLVFERNGEFFAIPRLYLNEQAIATSGNAHLQGWARSGYIITNPGNVTDFDRIAADLRHDCELHDVQEIPYDPALSRYFATKLVEEGLPMVEIRQAPLFFTQPVIQVENLVLEAKLHHDANPVMAWMISNVEVTISKFNGLRHPTKGRPQNKIDGPLALFLGLGRALVSGAGERSLDEFLANPIVFA